MHLAAINIVTIVKPENFEPQFWQQKDHNRFWAHKESIIFDKSTVQTLFAVEIISVGMNESKTRTVNMLPVIEIRTTPFRMAFLIFFFVSTKHTTDSSVAFEFVKKSISFESEMEVLFSVYFIVIFRRNIDDKNAMKWFNASTWEAYLLGRKNNLCLWFID